MNASCPSFGSSSNRQPLGMRPITASRVEVHLISRSAHAVLNHTAGTRPQSTRLAYRRNWRNHGEHPTSLTIRDYLGTRRNGAAK